MHVIVGMSGGVDSSVAALLLLEQGYRVSGLFMKNWEEDDTDAHCGAAEDLADAQTVCRHLDIPLHTVNFSHEYWDRVFVAFLEEHQSGRTPNPDVLCNKEIKFKEFLDRARILGADYIATGHYAGLRKQNKYWVLLRGSDRAKDQSYFLHTLDQAALSRTLFPLSFSSKTEVRALARDRGLHVTEKKDSTGICFIGERRFKPFLSRYLPSKPGVIVDCAGNEVGRHDGLFFYTIGQRHGLGIGGPGDPWYVVDKDINNNLLFVVQGHDHPALMSTNLKADRLHWVRGLPPTTPYRCTAKIRYRQSDQPCVIESTANGVTKVRFDTPQWAITPGQSVVFYQGEECLGGGVIVADNTGARSSLSEHAA